MYQQCSDRTARKVDRKWKRMIWKGTSTITTTAIKILAAIVDSCLIYCFIAWRERLCELLWFILPWKLLDPISQSHLVIPEFVQEWQWLVYRKVHSWTTGTMLLLIFCIFKNVSVSLMKAPANLEKKSSNNSIDCSRDKKNHIKNRLLSNQKFWCWNLVGDQNIVFVVLCVQKGKLCGEYTKYNRVTSGQRWYVKWWR